MKKILLGVLGALACGLPLWGQATLDGARAKRAEELRPLAGRTEPVYGRKTVVPQAELERRALDARGMKRAFSDAVKRPGGLTLAAEAGEQTKTDVGLLALRAKKWTLTRAEFDWTTPDGRVHRIKLYSDGYGRLLADITSPAAENAQAWDLVFWIRPVAAYYLISVKGPSVDEKGAEKELVLNIGNMPY